MMKSISTFLLAVTLLMIPQIQAVDGVDEIGRELVCPCGCGMILAECEQSMVCDVAKKVKGEIRLLLNEGKNKDEILSIMKQIYGEQVVATPPKEGFKLTLWTYPILGLVVGSFVVYLLSKRRKEVRWYVDPDERIGMSEDEFLEMGEVDREMKAKREAPKKYDEIFKKEYTKFKARKKKQKVKRLPNGK